MCAGHTTGVLLYNRIVKMVLSGKHTGSLYWVTQVLSTMLIIQPCLIWWKYNDLWKLKQNYLCCTAGHTISKLCAVQAATTVESMWKQVEAGGPPLAWCYTQMGMQSIWVTDEGCSADCCFCYSWIYFFIIITFIINIIVIVIICSLMNLPFRPLRP